MLLLGQNVYSSYVMFSKTMHVKLFLDLSKNWFCFSFLFDNTV